MSALEREFIFFMALVVIRFSYVPYQVEVRVLPMHLSGMVLFRWRAAQGIIFCTTCARLYHTFFHVC